MKVGDKVYNKQFGLGKIVAKKYFSIPIFGVEYIKSFDFFHDCDGKGEQGYCYWELENDLVTIEDLQLELFEDL